MNYEDFLKRKVPLAQESGMDSRKLAVNPLLKQHQADIVRWAVNRGRAALFESFGLGKSVQQLEILRLCMEQDGGTGRALIVAPLGVRQEFRRDAAMLGLNITFIRSIDQAAGPGLYITNYETVRDGKLDPRQFDATSLDEAACLRGFGGTKTFREFMRLFEGVKYKFVATATPSPNEFIELLAYSAYLEIMDVSAAKTRFFKRDSTKADKLSIHPHKEREFWMWVASWGIFLQKPSDLGYEDTGYALPPMQVIYHEVEVDHNVSHPDNWGQYTMFREATGGVVEAAREKRETLTARMDRCKAIIEADPDSHWIIWHDLEAERKAIEAALPEAVTIYGSMDLDKREAAIIDFSDGKTQIFAAKPVIAGSGCNFQKHCHKAIFLGVGFKFAEFIQACHRIYRFLQTEQVEIHIIHAESERQILRILQDKWAKHNHTVEKMSEIIKEYGLSEAAMHEAMQRSMGVERVEVSGKGWTAINNDCVLETANMPDNSVDLILTSIPFSTQYEYSPSYHDFGHTDDNAHFFEQMDYLTPNLLRVLQPGRMAAIHVKDRIVPGGMTGLGFQVVYPFHCRTIEHYVKHGFAYMGMITIVTDVVRENNQTYRLGWSEQCKDATKMGVGMPEYLLLFRKPPTSNENSYSDKPCKKSKPNCLDDDGNEIPFNLYKPINPGTGYSRARWQLDAHGFYRSGGNRLLKPEELQDLPHDAIFKLFREFSLCSIYDFEHHVKLGEALEGKMRLPTSFMLLQPQSTSPFAWTDITRMLTLNGNQYSKGQQMHLCPMQLDIADRVITRLSMPGETVLDPFGGLMTVPYRAVLHGRQGIGIELSPSYFFDGVGYCKAAEQEVATPSLFDILEEDDVALPKAA